MLFRPIPRLPASVEFLAGLLVAVLLLAIPLHWGVHTALLIVAGFLTADLIARLPWRGWYKGALTIAAWSVLSLLIVPAICEEYRAAHSLGKPQLKDLSPQILQDLKSLMDSAKDPEKKTTLPTEAEQRFLFVQAQLIIDSQSHGNYDFHISVTNTNSSPLFVTAGDYTTEGVAKGREYVADVTAVPNQAVSIPSLPMNGLKSGSVLYYNVEYHSKINGKTVWCVASYVFVLPRKIPILFPLNPYKEDVRRGILSPLNDDTVSQHLQLPAGFLALMVREQNQGGEPAFFDLRGGGRRIVLDAANGEIWFSSNFPDGRVKAVHLHVAKSEFHTVTISWNDKGDDLSLGADAINQMPGSFVSSTGPQSGPLRLPARRQQPKRK